MVFDSLLIYLVECTCTRNKLLQRTISKLNILHFVYFADVVFRDLIDSFINVGVAQSIAARINFQEELSNLEKTGKALPNRTRIFEPLPMVFRQYVSREIKIRGYANCEPKTSCFDYGLLTHIFEIKNNLDIDTCILPKNVGFIMQKHDDQHKQWAHALAIHDSSAFAINVRTSRSRPHVPMLSGTPVLNVSAYIQKLPNVTGDVISELDAHLAQAPMRLTAMGADPETNQANLILMSSFTGKLRHWAQQNTEALYSLTSVTQFVELVRYSFVIKDYQTENLILLVKLE